MTWESVALMTWFDVLICAITFSTLGILLRYRHQFARFNLLVGLSLVVSGLMMIGLFYVAELFVIWIMPIFVTEKASMAMMSTLHLNAHGINVLVVSLCLVGGFVVITRRLLSLIHHLEKSEINLNHETLVRQEINDELGESEKRFRDLIEGLTQGIVIARDGQALFVNQAFVVAFGYESPEDIIGMDSLLSLAAPHERERLRRYHEARIAGASSPTHYELQGVRRDGTWVWLDVHIRLMPWEGLLATQATVYDITSRKQTEEALRQSQERYATLMNAIDGLVWEAEPDSLQPTFLSKHIERLFGYTVEDWLTTPGSWRDRLHPEDREWVLATRHDANEQRQSQDLEYRVIAADGRTVWVRDIASVSVQPDGHVMSRGVTIDITAQKAAEHALRESEERFRQMAETIQEFFWMFDPHTGQMLYASPAYATIWGRTRESLYAEPLSWMEAVHDDDREILNDAWNRLRRGERVDVEYRIVRPDGTHCWIRDRGFPLMAANGELYRLTGIAEDITARKQAEVRISRYNQELEQAVQKTTHDMEMLMARMVRHEKLAAIGQISGSIAHELRNPLGAVKQSIFFLNRLYQTDRLTSTNPKVPEHLHLIDAEIDSAERVISQLLAFARAQPPKPEWLDLGELLNKACQQEPWKDGMQLIMNSDVDPFALWADRWHMEHVLINLLSNAADACSHQGIVTIHAHVDEASQGYQLAVCDTGCGIPADELEHVFEPLYTRKVWGTGLGLSLCQQLIEQQGGTIALESQDGQGTTVHLWLPLPPNGCQVRDSIRR